MNSPLSLKITRVLGLLEGTSFLLLLFVAMPLKYLFSRPEAVHFVGSAHGGLWILFCAAILLTGWQLKWPFTKIFLGWVSSVVPFGPFWFEKKLREENRAPKVQA